MNENSVYYLAILDSQSQNVPNNNATSYFSQSKLHIGSWSLLSLNKWDACAKKTKNGPVCGYIKCHWPHNSNTNRRIFRNHLSRISSLVCKLSHHSAIGLVCWIQKSATISLSSLIMAWQLNGVCILRGLFDSRQTELSALGQLQDLKAARN